MQDHPKNQPHNAPEEEFDAEDVQAIYEKAADMQSETLFGDDESDLTREEVEAGARRAGIDDKIIDAAIEARQREEAEEQAAQAQAAKNRAKFKKNAAIGGGVVGVLLLLSLLSARATLSSQQAQVEVAQAQVETALQRRHNLVPNLISVTKATLKNQSQAIETLRPLVQKAQNAPDMAAQSQAENQLSSQIDRVFEQLMQNNENSPVVLRLQDEMAGAENRIAVQRMRYNEAAAAYNRGTSGFMTRFWRPILGYPARYAPFAAEKSAQQTPQF